MSDSEAMDTLPNAASQRKPKLPYLLAVIPAFNEADTIEKILSETAMQVDFIIVIDDGSTDNTLAKAKAYANSKVIRNNRNLGKGASLRKGFIEALEQNPDIIITLDADGQHDPKDIPNLVKAIYEQDADIVVGSRYKGLKNEAPLVRRWGLSVINMVNRSLANSFLTDSQSGFRAFRKNAVELVLDLDSKGFGLETEQLAKAESYGLNIIEIPVKIKYAGLNRTSKRNSFIHGAGILTTLLKIAVERSPLVYFGIAGLMFIVLAVFFASQLLYLFNDSRYFSIPLALIILGFAVTGLLLILISFVLHVMKKIRQILQSDYRIRKR